MHACVRACVRACTKQSSPPTPEMLPPADMPGSTRSPHRSPLISRSAAPQSVLVLECGAVNSVAAPASRIPSPGAGSPAAAVPAAVPAALPAAAAAAATAAAAAAVPRSESSKAASPTPAAAAASAARRFDVATWAAGYACCCGCTGCECGEDADAGARVEREGIDGGGRAKLAVPGLTFEKT